MSKPYIWLARDAGKDEEGSYWAYRHFPKWHEAEGIWEPCTEDVEGGHEEICLDAIASMGLEMPRYQSVYLPAIRKLVRAEVKRQLKGKKSCG